MRLRRHRSIILTLLLLFCVVGGVDARELLDQDICFIDESTVIEGDAFVICGELTVNGTITGNIIGIARTAVINGEVDGSIYLAGLQLDVNGDINRDVHYLGLSLNVNAPATFEENSNVLMVGLSNTIGESTRVPGSVINLGYQLIINGDVGREVNFWGSALEVTGHVGGDVYATVGDAQSDGVATQIERLLIPFPVDVQLIDPGLRVTETGFIEGTLDYTGPSKGLILGEIGEAEIHNDTTQVFPVGEPTAAGVTSFFRRVFNEFITLGFIGVVGLLLIPKQMQSPLSVMQLHPISTFGVGMLSFILSFPITLILILFSLAIVLVLRFLPLDEIVLVGGLVLGLTNIGIASLFYFTALYISRVIVGMALGRFILKLMHRDDKTLRSYFVGLAIGLFLLSMSSAVPVVGWIFTAIALFLGLGAILSVLRTQFQRLRETPAPPQPPTTYYQTEPISVLPYFPEDAIRYTPPLLEERPRSLGMDNLPPGFDWWGEGEPQDDVYDSD